MSLREAWRRRRREVVLARAAEHLCCEEAMPLAVGVWRRRRPCDSKENFMAFASTCWDIYLEAQGKK